MDKNKDSVIEWIKNAIKQGNVDRIRIRKDDEFAKHILDIIFVYSVLITMKKGAKHDLSDSIRHIVLCSSLWSGCNNSRDTDGAGCR